MAEGDEPSTSRSPPAADDLGGVDPYTQARKALSLRSPFDDEQAAGRVLSLPAWLAAFLARHTDGRRKHKKAPPLEVTADVAEKPAALRPVTVWEQTEEYFRPITLADVDALTLNLPFDDNNKLDACFLVPCSGCGTQENREDGTFDAASCETSSQLEVDSESLVRNEKNAEQQEEQVMEVEEQPGTSGSALPLPEEDEPTVCSLHWMLRAKDRFVLTSERPNKKRKLLGEDAGLERLVSLPASLDEEAGPSCDFCCLGDGGGKLNAMLRCASCHVRVHQKCYGVHGVPEEPWLCSRCKLLDPSGRSSSRRDPSSQYCLLCPKESGAVKPVKREPGRPPDGGNQRFVHLFCCLWMPEVCIEDIEAMEPVLHIGDVSEKSKRLVCNVCKVKHGACVRCSYGTCRTAFHPICAREAKHQLEIWGKSGYDNVELRAFCSKHSTVRDMKPANRTITKSGYDSPEVRPKDKNVDTGKISELRFTRKTKDKVMMHESTNSSYDNMAKIDNVTLPGRTGDNHSFQSMEMDIDVSTGGMTLTRNSPDVALVLRKLIDRGKVSVGDVASEVGISSESLEAALVGETTTFLPGLKLKIIKWLQNSVHIPVAQLKTTKDIGKGSVVDIHDPVAKLSPPRKRTKGSTRNLKDNNELCRTGVTRALQNGTRKIVREASDCGVPLAEDKKKGIDEKLSSCSSQEKVEEEEHEELTSNTFGNEDSITSLELPLENKDSSVKKESNGLTEAKLGKEQVQGFSSLEHGVAWDDGGDSGASSLENGFCKCDCVNAEHVDVEPFLNFDGLHSYIHPLIKRKMVHLRDHNFEQNKQKEHYSKLAESSCRSSDQQHLHSSSTNMERKSDIAVLDQVSKAKTLGILELSPEDEIEGEIVHLQARLLDSTVAMKQTYEDLMLKVLQSLSQELDAFNRRKWDLIIVNQFLREVREAKKRGRKERKHKEAQAVLAAAAAAISASSRNSAPRKDGNDELISANQESPPKVISGSVRVGQASSPMPRTKDTMRSSNTKVSPDSNVGIFQMPIFSKENGLHCDVCMRSETVLNRVFVCSSCKVAVHLDCYHSLKNPTGPWSCEPCEEMSSEAATPSNHLYSDRNSSFPCCSLCGGTSGAFRKATDGEWVHAFCAEWLLETAFRRGQENLVDGMNSLLKEKDTCCVCSRKVGSCLKCSYGDCQVTFHPSCARGAGFYMNVKGSGGMFQHKAYCSQHSVEQREADSQQYGAEEIKSMKQMRVELEKLRLLCERIIKREKLKRDLVLCSNDILASRKDYVAFSVLVRSPFYAPDASSESATTSVNNKSYIGTMQRSDDVTVDSAVTGKQTIRLSLHNRDGDRNTDDSSTSQLSFKRKFGDRDSVAGKQLPQGTVTIALQDSEEDLEKKLKDKTHGETFQKELIMTSDQASMQNQRLPKGFAYVPIGYVSKEKPRNHDSGTCEPEEPGG